MRLPEQSARPAGFPALPAIVTHAFNITIPVLYAIIFATPVIGMIAAIEPVL
ncbi:hypothetical protein [Henriciella sp.]|uniref:hypothetical protein n=1 Tax=Henriciella sp. TaxID=1968823 RepID=UPI00262C9FC2|nr:hypothetical protein [Henriciella sp.]